MILIALIAVTLVSKIDGRHFTTDLASHALVITTYGWMDTWIHTMYVISTELITMHHCYDKLAIIGGCT